MWDEAGTAAGEDIRIACAKLIHVHKCKPCDAVLCNTEPFWMHVLLVPDFQVLNTSSELLLASGYFSSRQQKHADFDVVNR